MKRKLITFLMMAMVVAVMGTFSSCKDYEEDNYAELAGDYAALKRDLADIAAKLQVCCKEDLAALNARITALEGRAGSIEGNINDLWIAIGNLQNAISNNEASLADLLAKYQDVLSQIAALQAAIDSKVDQSEYDSTIADIYSKLSECDCSGEISRLEGLINTIQLALDNKADKDDLDKKADKDDLDKKADQDALDALKRAFEDFKNQEYQKILSDLAGKADKADLDALKTAYEAADAALQGQIDVINNKLLDFEAEIMSIKSKLNKLVTGVIVQGTYNPIFGSFSLPIGLQSNVLAAYYGVVEGANVDFPSAKTSNYFNTDWALTEKDMEMLGTVEAFKAEGGETLIDEEKGNAGTIYLTVNPSAVDFTGTGFTLVNSQNVESPVALGMLTPSAHTLKFGWTRAGELNNNFYEAKATVTKENLEDAKLKLDFNRSDVKEIIKDVLSPRDGINLTNIVNTVYSAINDISDAYGVRAAWNENGEGETESWNSVVSQYGVAATAVKPLSFAFMKDYHRDTFYGIDRIKNFVNRIVDGIDFNLNFGSAEFPELTEIRNPQLSPDKEYLYIDIVYNVPGDAVIARWDRVDGANGMATIRLYDAAGNMVGTIDVTVEGLGGIYDITINENGKSITITKRVNMQEFMNEFADQLTGDVNKIIEDLEDFAKDINDMLAQINGIQGQVDDAKESVVNQINKYIDAVNRRLCNVVNGVHARLQPLALAYVEGQGVYTLSQIQSAPTTIDGTSMTIIPTTYTAEMVVPAFKKHVAVTNVFKDGNSAQDGDAALISVLKSANTGDMNTVVAGTTREIEFKGQAGYVYEVAYSALDYAGKAVTKKFYVRFK